MSNFDFLESFDNDLFELGVKAEKQFLDGEYKDATHTLRNFIERVVSYVEKKEMYMRKKNMIQRLRYLLKHNKINEDLKEKFETVWKYSCDASHQNSKYEHDKQSTTIRMQDSFILARWLFNMNNTKKFRDNFDLTKIKKISESIKKDLLTKQNTTNGMFKIVKYFFDLSIRNLPDDTIKGTVYDLVIGAGNRTISYMVLLRKSGNDKVSNALYPAIYVYKNFGVAFSVYGKGGYCNDAWKNIEISKPLIKTYFEKNKELGKVMTQNPKFNYLDNYYEEVYKLSELNDTILQSVVDDFKKIQMILEEQRKD